MVTPENPIATGRLDQLDAQCLFAKLSLDRIHARLTQQVEAWEPGPYPAVVRSLRPIESLAGMRSRKWWTR